MPETAPNKVEITKRYHTITLADSDQVVTLTERSVNVVSTGVQGPRGARGADGPPGNLGGYTYDQDQPASIWTIRHNLGRKPSVTVIVDNQPVIAGIEYETDDQLTINFVQPYAGQAYLI